ncbi:peptidase S10 serine carboxypeptidase family protein [Nitzschia inconspicua]|uniref:Carboxypeptidase n=1 Tax=Nitzschia inconspicua TaxID=303405 RepID=A0A9K3LTT9_9STRA|nr:peptidase S10 serine carboxypeptidase family protein [Nitzschia inconspicua]KAG7367869.1 peptidase S10 serine carboxypeptidase family protein [Nitzschia inconspicua]
MNRTVNNNAVTIATTVVSRMMSFWVLAVTASCCCCCFLSTGTNGAPLHDIIHEIPLYGRPPTPQFSGYLDAATNDGCDLATNGPVCKLHYWLALAEDNDDGPGLSKPLVLWLNGGPGSSSVLGLLQEIGPLLMNATGGLMNNPWAWTRIVNVLILEAPMGVGYSYCSRQLEGKKCINTDQYTAKATRAALVDFFTDKYPEFVDNDFFITGESYAGVYIPTLAQQILDHPSSKDLINLKGIAVGDPCTDNVAQADSMDPLWYANKYGLMDPEIYDLLWNHCNEDFLVRYDIRHKSVVHEQNKAKANKNKNRTIPPPASIGKHANYVLAANLNQELHPIQDLEERKRKAIHLYHDRVLGVSLPSAVVADDDDDNDNDNKKDSLTAECTMAYRKYLLSSSHALSQGWDDLFIDDYSLFAPVTTAEDEYMTEYMNRDDVKRALHVEEAPIDKWPYPKAGFDYTKEYSACNWQDDILFPNISMVDIYMEIVPKLERTWIYNGNTDPCVSYEGTREAVKQILQPELDGGGYRPWFYNQTGAAIQVLEQKSVLFGPNLVAQDVGAQYGGEVVNYEEGLSFVTFHGSGHMVPQFRPQAALHFLWKFIVGGDLAPLLPSNATLKEMDDATFAKAMQTWTKAAQKPPYVDWVDLQT